MLTQAGNEHFSIHFRPHRQRFSISQQKMDGSNSSEMDIKVLTLAPTYFSFLQSTLYTISKMKNKNISQENIKSRENKKNEIFEKQS